MATETTTAPGGAQPPRPAPPESDRILRVRDLQTYFVADEGTTKAVDGASFDLFAGRTLGVVGETGCGKSVTARSILRIVERPGRIVGGEILLRRPNGDQQDLTKLDPDGREMREIRGGEIGLVFQEPMTSFSPVHTIGDQLTEAIRLHSTLGPKAVRERAIELLRLVGVTRPEGRMSEYSWQLSGGLRQRAMIAMSLAGEPRILIADEPTTALDVTTQAQILELLRELQAKTKMAILLITHDLGVIAEMADDVVVMYLGRVAEQGPVDRIFHAPQHPYTQALLRSIPSVNQTARVRPPTIAGSIPHPFNRPAGCPFYPRCEHFMKGICDEIVPQRILLEPRHSAACHLRDAEVISRRG
ncbi:MAG: ABC transporter ATP-binding protein [Chloroflexi bacterium]|nr:ABC transporter ATP-binding protein [Chloroflexota bacterium]